jgi:membrane-bound metal-dependent hydrolase YbcI (DUF457 family)
MPSPIAHLGIGYAIYRYHKHQLPEHQIKNWKFPLQMIMVSGLSMLPDLDVIPAIIFRNMRGFHNNSSHSLFVAIPVALLIASAFYRTYRSRFSMWLFICLISYDLHVIMDALTAERGVMMFWPLSSARFTSPIKIFYGLQWGLGFFSIWHLWTIFTESLFVALVFLALNYFDKRIIQEQENHK